MESNLNKQNQIKIILKEIEVLKQNLNEQNYGFSLNVINYLESRIKELSND